MTRLDFLYIVYCSIIYKAFKKIFYTQYILLLLRFRVTVPIGHESRWRLLSRFQTKHFRNALSWLVFFYALILHELSV